ncbi:Chemotaxis protein [Desulfonema limicola]|uniref:Chemotaxis protein n=1 Tax=Desulfonema limicola TaxID=45656 RepID=A0A975GE82_9BACT|nr:chemotaxis protein CheW [Desulfonema limicola]QTA77938.1 Chemotaxis protein [Desulfonema limicola]
MAQTDQEQKQAVPDDVPDIINDNVLETDEGQVVVFRLADEEFGVDIHNVKEIVRLPDITPIPRSPEYVAGICNLRGNVLPVIDTRTRFSMEPEETTDHTRLLVVESGGIQTSLIVDSVREVMRMHHAHKEPPPPVCRGIDREFLSSVIKVDGGQRLILMLNLGEVFFMETETGAIEAKTGELNTETSSVLKDHDIEEEQLVSFKLAGDVYAFNISRVREILKITNVTAVPNVPDYVKGLFTIRNHLMPIVDLRGLLGMPAIILEYLEMVDKGIEEDRNWVENLRHVVDAGSYFTGIRDSRETYFGQWVESYRSTSVDIEGIIKQLKKHRAKLFSLGLQVIETSKTNKAAALSMMNEKLLPLMEIVSGVLHQFKNILEKHISEDQRALVVEAGTMSIGFLVDWVDEVIRIPRSVIDDTPALAASERKELKAVAKLNQGERLIMIMDETALISDETSRVLKKIKKDTDLDMSLDKQGKTLAQQSMDEVQLVTFTINQEEYGIRIMQVQEINRATEITSVPRAPDFVDGMTNLRGNVIPVINIRSLFGLEDKEVDDRTRVIIVDIGGHKTGLRVDIVNEVLRLSKHDIEITPGIVTSGGANNYMEGVCKIGSGKRMVILLNMEKILDEKELNALNSITDDSARKQQGSKPRPSLKNAPEKKKIALPKTMEKKEGKKKKMEIDE